MELGQIIAPAKPRRAGEKDFPVLSMTMRDGLVNQADKFKKRIASADTSQYKVVGKNQLVVGFPIDEGVLAFQDLFDEAIVSPAYNIWNLQNDALIDTKYLEQFLRSPHALAFYKSKLRSTTARRRSLPNDVFLSLSVPVPPLAEQERIVQLLDDADELRKLRAQADRRAADLIPALFHEMFGDQIAKKSGWPKRPLGELTSRITKGESPGWQGFEYTSEGPMFITSENVLWGSLDVTEPKRIPPAFHKKLSRSIVRANDILLNLVGASIGRCCLVPSGLGEANINQAVAVVSLGEYILPDFLANLLLSQDAQNYFHGGKVEGARANISLSDVREYKTVVPPLPLQQEFARRVTEIRELEASQATSRVHLEHLFQSMLQRAFHPAHTV